MSTLYSEANGARSPILFDFDNGAVQPTACLLSLLALAVLPCVSPLPTDRRCRAQTET
jgi:hypothetical protein